MAMVDGVAAIYDRCEAMPSPSTASASCGYGNGNGEFGMLFMTCMVLLMLLCVVAIAVLIWALWQMRRTFVECHKEILVRARMESTDGVVRKMQQYIDQEEERDVYHQIDMIGGQAQEIRERVTAVEEQLAGFLGRTHNRRNRSNSPE